MPTVPLPAPWLRTQATYSFTDLAGVPPDTASALTKVANPATATKSRAGSKPGFFMTRGRMEMVWSCDKNTVLPSGVAAFKACAAIRPPAPARFSTTTGTPSWSLSLSARMRAIASVPPPGGKPTNTFTGPVWAVTPPTAKQATSAAVTRSDWRRPVLKNFTIANLLTGTKLQKQNKPTTVAQRGMPRSTQATGRETRLRLPGYSTC